MSSINRDRSVSAPLTYPATRRTIAAEGDRASVISRWAANPWVSALAITLALFGIVALSAAPRLWALMSSGLSGDEAVYTGQAALLAGKSEFARYFVLVSRGNSNFLLFQYVLAGLFSVFGFHDIIPRLASALASVATVLAVFEIGRTLYGRSVGLLAAFLLAISAYAIALGRVALLDSMLTLLFTLAMLAAAKWAQTERRGWLLAFSALAALAVQAKVTAILVIPIFLLYISFSGRWRTVGIRGAAMSVLVFVLFLAPAWLQLASDPQRFLSLLNDSSRRVSHVPANYYLAKMIAYEGPLMPVLWLGSFAASLRWAWRRDLLLLLWVAAVVVFFQVFPLKAFNYILPAVPAFVLLTARELMWLWRRLRTYRPAMRLAPAVAVAVVAALGIQAAAPVSRTIAAENTGGLREAGEWLAQHASPSAGIMTMSQGSAQYALSFYARRDAYPFGRFRLATVLPGGVLVQPQISANGSPRDWVAYWPPRLIQNRIVSYLVYYVTQPDDPPDDPLVATETQRQFRQLIERYGGQLVYTVYSRHEPLVWIYQVGKLLPRPQLSGTRLPTPKGGTAPTMRVHGSGYLIDSRITVYYHRKKLGTYRADSVGSFTANVRLPAPVRSAYQLVAIDEAGNSALVVGIRNIGRSSPPA
ncbi:MAG: glycosyltransferase family 39 protein [Chloroflexi bacterium]|nr:MAG: glycosyltransferase family 39 protein [Chloroflexota bacterium]